MHAYELRLCAGSGDQAARLCVLKCLQNWLKLEPSGGGGVNMAPGEIRAAAPRLLPMLIQSLGEPFQESSSKMSLSGELAAEILGPGKASAEDIMAIKVRE
jgi:hypothetical protein